MVKQSVVKINCYIEEYVNTQGRLCARLRDKQTNKKVVLTGTLLNKSHFLQFLSMAKIHKQIMPTVYERSGYDVVAVRGIKQLEDNDEITVCVDVEAGGYLFE